MTYFSLDLLTGANMLTKEQAYELAEHWVQAWNSHVLDEIMSHYAEDVVLVSPIAAKLLNDPLGTVRGKEALRDYFKKGLEVYPDLKFELIDVMWGLFSVVFYYINQKGSKAGEFMEVGSTGKITKVIANYNE
ncbi:nuclear transport factor 2 family protein [Altericista sp. CCNU0014]|uniref:nuclear transport factor 2 family protein n=1 Tax=Altericista sp. CCNU0014 TaxID=3082949 RepID=UPI00384E203C